MKQPSGCSVRHDTGCSAERQTFGEWNNAKIMVYKGTVVHGQNDENVLEYHLWTKQWTEMLHGQQVQRREVALGFRTVEQHASGETTKALIGAGSWRRCLVPQHPCKGSRLIPSKR